MRALVVEKPGSIRYAEVPKPELRPFDVLVKVSYAGICGTDTDIYSGETDLVFDYPVRIGHEWSGVVEELGPEAKGLKPGDRVVSDTWASCGECEACRNLKPAFCAAKRSIGTVNAWDGAFAEYMRLPYWHIYKVPDNVPLDTAALIEPATIAGNGLLRAGVGPDTSVLIIGSGAIGFAAAGLAKCMGVKKIIFAGRRDNKLAVAKKMGADVLINMTKENLPERVMEETGKGADRVIETSGAIGCFRLAVECAAQGGRVSPLGFYGADLSGVSADRLVINNISIVTSILNESEMDRFIDIPTLLDLVSGGSLGLGDLITHRIPFSEAAGAVGDPKQYAETKIKIIVDMNKL